RRSDVCVRMEAMGTIWALVERRAADTPDLLAFADEHDRRCTWAEVRDAAEGVAAGLLGGGIAPGDVVSWQLPTRIDTIVLSLALARPRAGPKPDTPAPPRT